MIQPDVTLFSGLLQRFGLHSGVCSWSAFINHYKLVDNDARIRLIAGIETTEGSRYVIKIIREREHPSELIQRQSVFSEALRQSGIPVPRRYPAADGGFVAESIIEGAHCSVTLEDQAGVCELEYINFEYVAKLAVLMADMHKIAEEQKCLVHGGTIWNFYNPQADISRGFQNFAIWRKEDRVQGMNTELYDAILELYLNKQNELADVWQALPRYAVQGDFSTNNLMLGEQGQIEAIIDFNISGDEVLVNDFITEGIFICYIMDLEPGLPETARPELLEHFIHIYRQRRPLSSLETWASERIYQLVFPFLWTWIEQLEQHIVKGEIDAADRMLQVIYHSMKERPAILAAKKTAPANF
jgi:Ser/Thr protein kinase RdoA (MazF antagonist)